MNEAIKQAIEALEEMFVIGDTLVGDVYGSEFVDKAKSALAALRAQPDHSELIAKLRETDTPYGQALHNVGALCSAAADALEGL